MYSDLRTEKLDSRGRVKRPALEPTQRFVSTLSLYVVRNRLADIDRSSWFFAQAAREGHRPVALASDKTGILFLVVYRTHRSTDSLQSRLCALANNGNTRTNSLLHLNRALIR